MEITDIKIRRIITEGRLRAVVSVTVDNMLAVHDIKVCLLYTSDAADEL